MGEWRFGGMGHDTGYGGAGWQQAMVLSGQGNLLSFASACLLHVDAGWQQALTLVDYHSSHVKR